MKFTFTMVLACLLFIGCKDNQQAEVKTVAVETTATKKDPNATYAKAEFSIDGMTCAIGCAATIQKNLNKKDGVAFAKVDFDKKLAMVEYNEQKLSLEDIATAVVEVSDTYTVSDLKNVEAFSTAKNKKEACKEDCKKDCCKKEAEKTAENCEENCKKPCCNKKT